MKNRGQTIQRTGLTALCTTAVGIALKSASAAGAASSTSVAAEEKQRKRSTRLEVVAMHPSELPALIRATSMSVANFAHKPKDAAGEAVKAAASA
jgi:hypothetical protein